MTTKDMPTTNQSTDEKTLGDKIPPTVAEGFEKAAKIVGNEIVSGIKKAAGNIFSNL